MTRFLHTSDWQLGRTRDYLSPRGDDDPQARYTSARIDAVRELGRLARQEGCAFVLVAGDVFETQNVPASVVTRSLDAIASIALPTYLLPGNHDSLEPGTIWDRLTLPPNAIVVRDDTPLHLPEGIELIGAPLRARHVHTDPLAQVARGLHADGATRILLGHGQLAGLTGDTVSDALIDPEPLRQAIARGALHYVALGDRHIAWPDDPHATIRYSGTQETTSFTEPGRGTVVIVDLTSDGVATRTVEVGTWLHTRVSRRMASDADIDALDADLSAFPRRDRTIVRHDLHGQLTIAQKARLDALLASHGEAFASLEPSEHRSDLVVVPDRSDLAQADLPSWARDAAEHLAESARAGDRAAVDALTLLHRLTLTTGADS
ncbi:metallophosphoesterase family protein [Acidipropionibacterium timonense]|uniref:metallophosphoesterase family protein n=1 Tax=Acidipropionibacterium timonense TaxID=2161818 RepID=UPI00103188B2|nr:DNA repair exonuclease [Acidipropionibacterium timonense]